MPTVSAGHRVDATVLLDSIRLTPEESERALARVAGLVRGAAGDAEYDSIIGLSGGVDSSYAAWLASQLGLRPLAVHFDNGWDSEIAVQNIQGVVEATGFDLHTYVINWREFRDLQRAFLRASVIDIELLTDHAILASTVKLAQEHGVKYLLTGANVATEHGMPRSWVWPKQDWTNIKSIHDQLGEVPLKTFPHLSTVRWRALQMTRRGVSPIPLLDYINYRRDEAAETLARETGWRDYGGKHHELVFTRFYQGAILPQKFGVDKRRVHLSDRVRNGEMTREEAMDAISQPPYGPDELRVESEYVRKKLGFSEAEWQGIMESPPRSHLDFSSDRKLLDGFRPISRVGQRLDRAVKARART